MDYITSKIPEKNTTVLRANAKGKQAKIEPVCMEPSEDGASWSRVPKEV